MGRLSGLRPTLTLSGNRTPTIGMRRMTMIEAIVLLAVLIVLGWMMLRQPTGFETANRTHLAEPPSNVRTRDDGDGDDASPPVRLATARQVLEEHLADRFVTRESGAEVEVACGWSEVPLIRGRFYLAAERAGVMVKTARLVDQPGEVCRVRVTLFR